MLFLELAVTNQVWDSSYSKGEMGMKGREGGVVISVFALHVCVSKWATGCVNVCASAGECMNNRFDSQPSICVCFSACFHTLAGILTREDTTRRTRWPFFKREQACNL